MGRTSTSLYASVLSGLTLCLCSNVWPGHLRSVSVILAQNNSVTPFFARMSTGHGDFVVTDDQHADPADAQFYFPKDQQLYLAEFHHKLKVLPTELMREGHIVLFTAPSISEAMHLLDQSGEHIHPIQVGNELIAPDLDVISSQKIFPPSQPILPDISLEDMKASLEEFTGAKSTTIGGNKLTLGERSSARGRELARQWLKERYEALGMKVTFQNYGNGQNLIAEKVGAIPTQILIINSHYDTMDTVGADDDGAGTISALMIARSLASTPLNATVRFVAFDQEELGLVGSKAFAKSMNVSGEMKHVIGAITLEMTSYDSDNDGAFHSIHCGKQTSSALSSQLEALITKTGLDLKRVEACTNRSDHASFWDYNRAAIAVSQNFFDGDPNPCYHKKCDTSAKANWSYMHKLTTATAALTIKLAQ